MRRATSRRCARGSIAELPAQLSPALRAELAADLARAPAENLRRAATPIGVASVGWDAALASLG